MNKAYKVSHILDDVLEAYDDEMGVDPDSYYVVNDGEIIDGPFDTEDEANDASENDYDEVVYGADYLGTDDDEDEEDYDIDEGKRGRPPGMKNGEGRCAKEPGTKWNAKRGACFASNTLGLGRPRKTMGPGNLSPKKRAARAARLKTPAATESLASSIIRKINSF